MLSGLACCVWQAKVGLVRSVKMKLPGVSEIFVGQGARGYSPGFAQISQNPEFSQIMD